MNNQWNVEINSEGHLYIRGQENMGVYDNLFGVNRIESGICVYSDELKSVLKLLNRLFPDASIKSLDAIEYVIKMEFCELRTVGTFKCFLENAQIPYRSFSNAA